MVYVQRGAIRAREHEDALGLASAVGGVRAVGKRRAADGHDTEVHELREELATEREPAPVVSSAGRSAALDLVLSGASATPAPLHELTAATSARARRSGRHRQRFPGLVFASTRWMTSTGEALSVVVETISS